MAIQNCPNCGAPAMDAGSQCVYCNAKLPKPHAAATTAPKTEFEAGDFGLRSNIVFVVAVIGAAILYALGWIFEDTRYWLDDRAIAVWAGALPLWLCILAFIWRPRWGEWLAGFAIAVPVFIVHLAIMWLNRGMLNDDYIGIAAAFASASLGGWILGRLLHTAVRRSRNKI